MTSSVQQLFTFVVMLVAFMMVMLPHVNCQVSIYKNSFFTDDNCTTAHTTSFYKQFTPCSSPPKCNSYFNSKTNTTSSYNYECVTEFPTAPAYGFLTTFRYQNHTLQCSGPIESVTAKAMNICMNDPGTSDYVIYDNLGNRNLFNDKNCTSKNSTISMYLGECILGFQKTTTLGYVPPPPKPPTPVTYARTGLYNASMSGGTTCLSSAMTTQMFSPSSCITPECKDSGVKFGGETFYHYTDCVTELPTTASYGSVNTYRHKDQNSCQTQTNFVIMEVYPVNSCSPHVSYSNGVEFLFIKSEDCKFIRKYNDSSCLNEISQVDLSTRNGICDSTGVKYLCNSNNNTGGGGSGGNGGEVTPGNSTRVVINSGSRMHQLSLILSIVFTLLSIFVVKTIIN